MKKLSGLAFLMIILPLRAACQRQPVPTAIPTDFAEVVVTEESTATTTAVTTPTQPAPTSTATPTLTPTPQATATTTATPAPSPTPTAAPLTVTEEMTFELVAHKGGEARSVAVDGNIAYVGVGPRLVVLDVSNPASPQFIGRSEVLPGLVDAVVLENDGQQTRAYAAAGDQVVALAPGAAGEMTMEGTVDMPGYTRALTLAEGRLYAGGIVPRANAEDKDGGFIASVAVQLPEALRVLEVTTLAQPVTAIAQDENALYVGHNGGLSAGLVANGRLENLRRLGGVSEVDGLQVVGGTLLVGSHMKLHAFDISARNETGLPRVSQLWRIDATPELFLPMIEGIAVRDDTIYTVGNLPAGNYIPSRLAFPAPEPFDGEAAHSSSPLVALSGNHLFVAEGDVLEIYDISRPGELVHVGGYGAAFPAAGDLAIDQTPSEEEILYLYDGSPFDTAWERLFSYRLPMLQPLGQLTIEAAESETQIGQRAQFELALDAAQAYLSTVDGIYQIDIDNPATPHITAYEPYGEDALNPRGLIVQGDGIYLAKEIYVYPDILVTAFAAGDGALEQAAQLDGFPGDTLAALTGADDKLYVTTDAYPDHGWLHIMSTGGDEMTLLSSLALPGNPVFGVLATNGSLVSTIVGGQLLLIDVSAPEQPVITSTVALPGRSSLVASALDFHGGRLFVVVADQLLVVDVTNPAHPRAVGAAKLPSARSYPGAHLAVSDHMVAVAMGEIGVFIFEVGR